MNKHYAKECRASIEVITSNTAQCRVCGQTYKRTNHYGKLGWQRKEDDNRLVEYIRSRNDKVKEEDMTNLERAKAMKCFRKLVENVELDPDPNTQDKLQEEYNCKNCDSFSYCSALAGTLEKKA